MSSQHIAPSAKPHPSTAPVPSPRSLSPPPPSPPATTLLRPPRFPSTPLPPSSPPSSLSPSLPSCPPSPQVGWKTVLSLTQGTLRKIASLRRRHPLLFHTLPLTPWPLQILSNRLVLRFPLFVALKVSVVGEIPSFGGFSTRDHLLRYHVTSAMVDGKKCRGSVAVTHSGLQRKEYEVLYAIGGFHPLYKNISILTTVMEEI